MTPCSAAGAGAQASQASEVKLRSPWKLISKHFQPPTANIPLFLFCAQACGVQSRYWGDPDGGGFFSKTNMCLVVVTFTSCVRTLGLTPCLLPTYFPLLTNQRHPWGESTTQQDLVGWA